VPAGDRDRIFEPFYTTKTSGQGTGLGLSIARNIVDRHGGEISVSEADAGGALFSVLLPIARARGSGRGGPGAPTTE
jgi:signal transduction histidine kinase